MGDKRNMTKWTRTPNEEEWTGYKSRVIICPKCGRIPESRGGKCLNCGSKVEE